jgi:hypothetical protein
VYKDEKDDDNNNDTQNDSSRQANETLDADVIEVLGLPINSPKIQGYIAQFNDLFTRPATGLAKQTYYVPSCLSCSMFFSLQFSPLALPFLFLFFSSFSFYFSFFLSFLVSILSSSRFRFPLKLITGRDIDNSTLAKPVALFCRAGLDISTTPPGYTGTWPNRRRKQFKLDCSSKDLIS